jgi:uncharacterized protein DUF2568
MSIRVKGIPRMLATLRIANLALAFMLELCLLGAVGYWGFQVGSNTALKFVLGLGAPLLVAVFWGIVLAPRAPVPVPEPWHTVLAAAVFALGVTALFASGQPAWGVALGVAFAVNRVLFSVVPE